MRKGSLKPEVLAIIPARGGSKRLPRKNVRPLYGKPLVGWTIEAALTSVFIDRIVVTTEDKEIAEIARAFGAEVIKRPAELATDETLITPVLEHAVKYLEKRSYKPDIIVLLNPTSPLRSKDYIDAGLRAFLWTTNDSCVSVTRGQACLWFPTGEGAKSNYDYTHKPRGQDAPDSYWENGAIYIVRRDFLMKEHLFIGGKVMLYVLPTYNAIDIDTEIDFKIAELLMKEALSETSTH